MLQISEFKNVERVYFILAQLVKFTYISKIRVIQWLKVESTRALEISIPYPFSQLLLSLDQG